MEIRQLDYFVAVAEEASFTRGAARVHVAQPGVSAQIQRLERELGHPLFDRSERNVRLTTAGEALLPRARAALAAVAAVRSTADGLSGLLTGRITIGTVSSTTSGDVDLAGLLAAFHRDHPGVDITLSEGRADDLVESVRVGRIDAAFAAVGPDDPPDVMTATVRNETLAAAVVHGHPLATATSITLAELVQHPLITLPRGSGVRSIVESTCAALGVRPNVCFEAGNPLVVAQLAAGGLGVAIVPGSVAVDDPALQVVSIEPQMTGRIVLAWRANGYRSPASVAFVERACVSIASVV